ncbi:malectin domain-containing carbohydrate-binding protein [Haloarchaeobius sp. HRN-SO-5]|uniref:malectin domain-containing carbohydrate-binding protein n=1 Tax=Haloarchaeobius sp. HRN-SO-5 TaxID=3446118 RepID=UPI003EBC1976
MQNVNGRQRVLAILLAVLTVVSIVAAGATGALTTPKDASTVGGQSLSVADEEILYRANAGGSFTTSTGDQWTPLVDYMVSGNDNTGSFGQPSTIHDSVPTGTPSQIWEVERYDTGSAGDGNEMQYEFSVPQGQQVEVRLYFYDGYSGTSSVGDRVFDVSVEDQTIEDFDIIERFGDDTGAMESFTVTSDGTVDVDFAHVTENPQVNAIEIVTTEASPGELGGPSSVDFGTVVTGESATETVTLTNLGNESNSSHPDIAIDGVSVTGTDADQFSNDFSGSTTLQPGESTTVDVTYSPSEAQAHAGTLEVSHNGTNSPLTVDLGGEGTSDVPVGFGKSQLQGFDQGSLTALEFGPDGRLYVAQQNGMVYALNITRDGENSYSVESQETIGAVQTIPNHDDTGTYVPGETTRQVTGLTVGGTASQPVVYVSSSDPTIDVGTDDDDTDTNSGAISRLTFDWNADGSLANVDHTVMVLGLPRSEENHATNGLDLSDDGSTLYVAQGGHTNKGAPGNNFGHTPEYALSGAVLEIDLAQIEANHSAKNLQSYDADYPSLEFMYAIPTIQNDDATDGDDLPFGGNDGINQAKWIENGPVQVYSSGYRNPYDLVLSEDDQLYVIDNGPNGGWGGQPVDEGPSGVCSNQPNEDGSYGTGDQLHLATEGSYGGHAAPIRGNPTGADIYDADGNLVFDITEANSPVPASEVDPVECDYQDPTEDNSIGDTFSWTGGIEEYTASNFGGEMQGDLLVVETANSVERVELNATGEGVTNQENNFFSDITALGITAQGDGGPFPGTVWTARGSVTVFEPNDIDTDPCSGEDDPTLDEDGDGYDNADELDVGTDPCSAASTPPDFDDDDTSNLNDPDDDNDGQPDTSDPFAVDPDDGTTTTLPVQMDFSETSLFTEDGQGWTGLMTNGQDDYQDLYDPGQMTVGGAAQVLTVENVPTGDAVNNDQQFAFQRGVAAPDDPFTVSTTVNGFPADPSNYQSMGLYVGNGDQDNYLKLVTAANGGTGGIQFAGETGGSFTNVAQPDDPSVTGPGNDTDLSMTVYPSNGTVEAYYTPEGGQQTLVGETTIPDSWLNSSDGTGLAVGVISTSYQAGSTFDATWTHLDVEYVDPPANQPPIADAGDDQSVDEGTTVQLDASGSTDPDGDDATLGYTWTQTAGPSVSLSANDVVNPTFTAPEVDGDATLTFQVSVSDGVDSTTDTVNVTVQDTDATTAGEVVYRVNAGGPEVAAGDGGPAWSADTATSPSTYVNADGDNGLDTYSTGDSITLNDSVPSGTPETLFQTERYDVDTAGSTADDTEMQWSFDVQQGETYEVRLYFAEIFLDSSNVGTLGPRTFDVLVEGDTKLNDYNLYEEYGHDVGVVESYEVTPSDGTIDVAFLHEQENPKISAIEIVNVSDSDDETLSLEAAVASADETGDDSQIEFTEVQMAVNWWQTGQEVPDTGGETIEFTEMQTLVNLWQTDATVDESPTASLSVSPQNPTAGEQVTLDASGLTDPEGDDLTYSWVIDGQHDHDWHDSTVEYAFQTAGDHTVQVTVEDTAGNVDTASQTITVSEATGTALVEITPDSDVEATTYGQGSYQVTNTGEKNIAAVSFDLSSASYPDMVFDPNGTAGDPTGEGLNIVDEGGTNITTEPGTWEAFSQPHNGVDGDDGYDVMTVEFGDFDPGEMATFWADNDPTSIKGATVSSQEAGPVSGLELAGSTVTVTYEDGTTQTTQLMGDGSAGGSTANVTSNEQPAPTIGAEGVTLDSGILDARHSAATVSSASQTITVTGQAGETVTLVRAEGELTLSNVPDADDDGEPGYDIEAYEANDVETVEYYTVTLDSSGEATVPVTLTNTTSDGDDNAGYNYFTAVHGEPNADAGLASNVVVLKLDAGSDTGTTDQPVYAVNAGGPNYTAVDGTEYVSDASFGGSFSGSAGTSSTTWAIGNTEDDTLYQTERYGDPLSYAMPVDDGTYNVTLQFAEIWHTSQTGGAGDDAGGDGEVGDRVFDVSIEGQQVLSDYDIYQDVGGLNATQKTFTVEVTDGTLDMTLDASTDYAKVSAFTVENASSTGGGTNTAPTVDAVDDQTVIRGETVTVPVSASDADGDALSLSTSGPAFVDFTDDGDGTGTLTVAPKSGDTGTYTVDVTADDGTDQTTESFQLTVDAGTSLTDGVASHRVNVGESTTLGATDGGPDWTGVAGTSSPYLVSVGSPAGNYCGGDTVTPTSAVPASTPDAVYDCERYGPMQWTFPTDGQEVEVRLYLSNQFSGASEVGQRQFNVSVEGTQVLTQYDPVADAGHANGTVKAFTATDQDGDGNVTVAFETGAIENPQVNAIEVVNLSSSSTTSSAELSVTENGGIDASTYNSGSFEITNTGAQEITSVTYDLGTSTFPDVVFDPEGTAGDAGSKGFTPDSGGSTVGVVDGSFTSPHNGVDGSDGYDVLTATFDDFDADETFTFSADIDPTSIKDATGTGAAGAVSGLELSGATVTVEYADGTTQTSQLFGDGSSGGSQATAKETVESAPTIGVDGVTLDSSALDPEHSAATVSSASQTITISGQPGQTVQLLHVEGQLELDQATGYELEQYEANTAEQTAYQTVTLDSNGEATVDVTLTNTSTSGVEGGFNYFVATVQDGDGDTGQTSTVVILKLESSS